MQRIDESIGEVENAIIRDSCDNNDGNVRSGVKRSPFSQQNFSRTSHNEVSLSMQEKENSGIESNKVEMNEDKIAQIKQEMAGMIENVRNEIYDNLDDILQSHVTALEEKKLLATEDEAHPDHSIKFQNIFHDLAKDLRIKVGMIEKALDEKADIVTLEEKMGSIIETIAELEENIPTKGDISDLAEIICEKSNIDDVSKAFEDVYKILEEKYTESPSPNLMNRSKK